MPRSSVLFSALSAVALAPLAYLGFVATLALPPIQTQVVYLNKVVLTWFQDVNYPEQWGFLPNQVTPFYVKTPDEERLHAWHILPLGLYEEHKVELVAEPFGLADDIKQRLSYKLLRDDPESLLVLYFHGAAGTLGSGFRPPSYRAIHALSPKRIHTVAIDYRGFGASTGHPTEDGLLTDAKTLLYWAIEEVGIPPNRIVFFAQSLGTAVTLSLSHELAVTQPENFPRGIVLVAPFTNTADLSSTYSVAGVVPLLAPLVRFPTIFGFFVSYLIPKWPSKDYLASLIGTLRETPGAAYDITILHAKDDWDIPWSHSEALFWAAVEASTSSQATLNATKIEIVASKQSLGPDGWSMEWRSDRGVLRQEIVEYGLHDRIMSYPLVSQAIWRTFKGE